MPRIETYKKKSLPKKYMILGIIASLLIVSSSLVFLLFPFPSTEKVSYLTGKHQIIYNGKIHEEAIVSNDVIYLPLAFIQKEMDPSVTLDKETNAIIITTKDKVIQMPSESLTSFVNGAGVNIEVPAMITKDNIAYVSYSTIQKYYPFEVSVLQETEAIHVIQNGDTRILGEVIPSKNEHEHRIRKNPTLTSPYFDTVKSEEIVTIEKEENEFYFVRKQNGIAGFIHKDNVKVQKTETVVINREETPRFSPTVKWPINLTWEAVYTKNPDTNKLPALPGVNVVSPTWFSIKNEAGDIANLGSMEYMNWAKSKNIQVWGLFSNDFNPELTHNVLANFETRQAMIRQLLQYSEMYKLNGINVDFENVNLEDGKLLTQFMRELTPYMHEAGLTVSMDITFISTSENWSMFYERDQLASIVDYLIVMAYDEHWGTSPVAGSVASFPWVEQNLKSLLEVVPHDQVILGLPTYSRIWKEQDTEGGNIEVSSKAYSMNDIGAWIKEKQVTPVHDEKSGQMYAVYQDENEKAIYKVWIEDRDSLARRSQMVHHYNLAGVATWNRYFASDDAWSAIDESLKRRK
ncbi:glycosyl hydrolase family 18 protein [Bacillus suaedaesalsae]|uniref:Peptidoglycan hydrolase n=1 Tax=Bacillus suaedaesalsae TaxID=2810349 RepID=A0ABS2DMX2_9BACI|nr:glycosyl hydrolase family 18 protein [Bacillus suaedaesalsae]MBM6618836.1 peptidoglycan hydrolase [Bacillus suaedaesalsae]